MKQIPTNHQYTQPNVSDVTGEIFISKGIDLTDNAGKVRVGKRMVLQYNSGDMTPMMQRPAAFRQFDSGVGKALFWVDSNAVYWAQGYTTFPIGGIVRVTSYNTDSRLSDMEVFAGKLYITGTTQLLQASFSGSVMTLTPVGSTLSSLSTHMMCVYNGRLYVTDAQNKIYSWDGSAMVTTGSFSLTIPSPDQNTITFVRAAANRIWIGVVNQTSGRSYVYEWDGASATVTKEHRLDAPGALACVIKDDIPYVMDAYGRLLAWNGGTFKELARLPRRQNRLFYNPVSQVNDRFVHPNGMAVIGNRINILLDTRHNDATYSVEETLPAGVWEYDETIGLYHKHALSQAHATDTITDYGAARIAGAGALFEVNYPNTASTRNGTFAAGADYYTDATTTTAGLFYDDSNDTLQKAGYFVTPKIEATDGGIYNLPTVEAMWLSVNTMYRKLLNSTDRIEVKYRTQEDDPVEATITWTSPTKFTVPSSSINVSNYWTGGTGGEVEVVQGTRAGMCVHITNAVLADNVWTVTVDGTFPGTATGTAVARFQNWKSLGPILPNNQNFDSDNVSKKSTWIQLKFYMLFTGRNEIERILISNSNGTPLN